MDTIVRKQLFLALTLAIFFAVLPSYADFGSTTYQAKIVKPDGDPLEANSVNFRFTILNPAGTCIIYTENYSSISMANSGGLISFSLGSGIKSFPVSSTTFADVFSNSISTLTCAAGGPATYSPGANDTRKIVMQFQDTMGWQTLPAMNINAVPYAMYAKSAQNLNGKIDSDFVQVSSIPTCVASQALFYNGAQFTCVAAGGGSSGGGSSYTVTANDITTALGYSPVAPASYTAVTTQISTLGTSYTNISNTISGLGALAYASSLDLGSASATGIISDARLANMAQITSGTQYSKVIVDGKGRVVSGSQWTAAELSSALGVPSCGVNQYLTFNGTSYSCAADSGASGTITSVSVTGPLSATTGTNPIISLNYSSDFTLSGGALNLLTTGVVPGTYTKLTVDSRGRVVSSSALTLADVTAALAYTPADSAAVTTALNNKITSSAVSIAQVLGYVPAASGSAGVGGLLAVNDLSDLASATVARTNLGLGLFATRNSLISSDVTSALTYTPANSATVTTALNTKITSSAVSIAQVLGYVPAASGSAGVGGLLAINNLSDLASATVARTNLELGLFATRNSLVVSDVTTALTFTPADSVAVATLQTNLNAVSAVASSKITSSAVSIAQVLGYVPAASGSAGVGGLLAVNNLSDLVSATVARSNLGLGLLSTLNFVDLGSSFASGTLAIARTPAYTGDVTKAAASSALILSPSGVAAGIYTKVTVDTKGRVTSGSTLTNADVISALGYTPGVSGVIDGISSLNGSTMASQTFANGTTGLNPAFATAAGVHTLNIPLASAASVTAGLLSNVDYISFSNKLSSSTASVIAALGYTPANSATVTTALNNKITSSAVSIAQVLGYVPAASGSVASSQWNTSGTTINYSVGNVGIGTSAPTAPLHVVGNIISAKFGIDGGFAGSRANGTEAAPTQVLANERINYLLGSAYYTGGSSGYANTAGISMWAAQNQTDIGRGSYITFETTASGAITRTERMRVDPSGNVGIGVAAPTAKLQLAAGTSTIASLKLTSGTLLTAPQPGAIEYDGADFYITDGASARRTIATATSVGTLDNVSRIDSTSSITMFPASGNSVIVSGTVASTSSSTGALIVRGGLGVSGNIFSSGTIITSSNIQGVSVTATSGLITPWIYGSTAPGGDLRIDSTTSTTKGDILLAPSGGRVGIGTINPTALLEVSGTIKTSQTGSWVSPAIQVGSAATGLFNFINNGELGIAASGTSAGRFTTTGFYLGSGSGARFPYTGGSAASPDISFFTHTSTGMFNAGSGNVGFSSLGSEKMRIASSGNVGIGTTAPTATLEVSGTFKINDNITLGNQATRTTASSRGQINLSSTFLQTLNTNVSVSWDNGNLQEIATLACNGVKTITMTNVKDGATYSLYISGSPAHTDVCVFVAAGYTFKTSGGAKIPTAGQDVLYTFTVMGNRIIYNMVDDLQ